MWTGPFFPGLSPMWGLVAYVWLALCLHIIANKTGTPEWMVSLDSNCQSLPHVQGCRTAWLVGHSFLHSAGELNYWDYRLDGYRRSA